MPPAGLLLTQDLLFTSQVTGHARALGLTVQVVGTVDAALACVDQGHVACIFFDLEHRNATPEDLFFRLPVETAIPVIAFGPHVATARLAAARDAGCAEVLPRSKFSATLPDLLRKYLARQPSPPATD